MLNVSELDTVRLRDFYPQAADLQIPILPGKVFVPDEWTQAIAGGIQTKDFSGQHVIEVGVGTGVSMAGIMATDKPPTSFIGTDICLESIEIAGELAANHGWNAVCQESDLLESINDTTLSKTDEIFACIPQVPRRDADLNEEDGTSHYYIETGSEWDTYGLGLNEELLRQATERAPQATVTLNLSGRPGIKVLESLFETFGRKASVIHETIVPQHAGTSLRSLARLEKKEGHAPFEFFADAEAKKPISASKAEWRRKFSNIENKVNEAFGRSAKWITPPHHKIYVISAPGVSGP